MPYQQSLLAPFQFEAEQFGGRAYDVESTRFGRRPHQIGMMAGFSLSARAGSLRAIKTVSDIGERSSVGRFSVKPGLHARGVDVAVLSVGRRVVGDLAQRVAAAADLYRPVALVHSPYTVAVFRAIVSPAPPCDNVVVRIRSCPVHAATPVTRRLIRLRVQEKSLNLLIIAN